MYGVTIALHHLYSDGDNTSLTLSGFLDMVVLQVVYWYDATITADLPNNHSDGDLFHLFCPGVLKL